MKSSGRTDSRQEWRWPLQNQPVQTLYWIVNQIVPRSIGNTDPVRKTRPWYNVIGQAVQSLYGRLLSNRALRFLSQSTLLQHTGDLERELMGRHHEIDFFWDLKTPTHRGSVKNSASAHARSCRRKAPSVTQLRSPAPRRYLSMSSTASVLSQDIRTLSWSQWERPELHRVADSQLGDRATTCERDAHLHPEDLRGVMAIHIAKNACTAHRKTPVHGSIPLEATYKVPRFPATKAALALRCCSA